jgi:aldehyde dehydrogenase (NAD+)
MATTANRHSVRSFDALMIGGRWVAPSSDAVIEVSSPITEEAVATVPEAQEADVDAAVEAARRAFDEGPWPRMTPQERGAALLRVADALQESFEELVETWIVEMGAPRIISEAFHRTGIDNWRMAARLHERVELEEVRTWWDTTVRVVKEPVGVVAAIIPWNGPVATAGWKMGPALAAGCPTILKAAPEGPVNVMILAEALARAGLPEGVASVLPAEREVSEHLVRHRGVDKISFTGSTAAGRRIMGLAAERIARVTLELGGKSAAIIADDVPLDDVIPVIVPAGIGHSGQVCAALTRILVPRERHDEVTEAVRQAMEAVKVGDPAEPDTFIGPLAAKRQQDRVLDYIRVGREEGATLVTGGGVPDGIERGWYVEPTLFANVENGMRIAQEEIFGPVLTIIPFDSTDEAVAIANDSPYGLSGAVFASDIALGESIARRVRTGQMSVNTWAICNTQPFGGFKQSGLGREGGIEGIEPYLETKVIQGLDAPPTA